MPRPVVGREGRRQSHHCRNTGRVHRRSSGSALVQRLAPFRRGKPFAPPLSQGARMNIRSSTNNVVAFSLPASLFVSTSGECHPPLKRRSPMHHLIDTLFVALVAVALTATVLLWLASA